METCESCGGELARRFTLAMSSHADWDRVDVRATATYDDPGTVTLTCNRCGANHVTKVTVPEQRYAPYPRTE